MSEIEIATDKDCENEKKKIFYSELRVYKLGLIICWKLVLVLQRTILREYRPIK